MDVRIRPKTPMPTLLSILAEVHELPELRSETVAYDSDTNIVDLLVQSFLVEVQNVVRQGLRRTYAQESDELIAIRGRIEFSQTIRMGLRGMAKTYCSFEEFTLDASENRLLLAGLRAVTKEAWLPPNRRNSAHRMGCEFLGVDELNLQEALSLDFQKDRLNQGYFPALNLAKLVLEALGVTQELGSKQARGFLVNMNQLFELYVERKLRSILSVEGIQVHAQNERSFDEGGMSKIRPDLLLQHQSGRRLVADVKYKTGVKAKESDLYQMLTYCRILKIRNGVLITVGPGPGVRYKVCDGSTVIDVIPVNLDGDLEAIEQSIQLLTNQLRDRMIR
ncbi:hypothetical protein CKO51_25700 [Rhodopirellula sp. SM50]|nr:hypothetical protein CKO51_25700 [Rhodopirellula sp. SM50]